MRRWHTIYPHSLNIICINFYVNRLFWADKNGGVFSNPVIIMTLPVPRKNYDSSLTTKNMVFLFLCKQVSVSWKWRTEKYGKWSSGQVVWRRLWDWSDASPGIPSYLLPSLYACNTFWFSLPILLMCNL